MRAAEALEAFARLPVVGLDAIAPGPVVVLAPHPDDESLGCGGLIAQACARGASVHVAVLTDGGASHPNSAAYLRPALAALREAEAVEACGRLGMSPWQVRFLGAQDARAPRDGGGFDALVDALSRLLRACGAETLLCTWAQDPHRDHQAAHLIASAAARRTGARLRSYPVWGWTLPPDQDVPAPSGVRLDVSGQLEAKRLAIAAHRSQTTDLIADDPEGFRLGDDVIGLLTGPYEVYLDA